MTVGADLRVWHVDTIGSPESVDGVAVGLWLLAAEQSSLGADVTMFLRTEPDERGRELIAKHGIRTRRFDRSIPRARSNSVYRGLSEPPDLLHFHSGWIPLHPYLARAARRRGIPYVQTPHGAYSSAIRASKRLPRSVYVAAIEAPYGRRAGGVVYCHDAERDQFHATVPGFRGLERTIPFPIDVTAAALDWQPAPSPHVVFLGRFEPFQKGLDRLVEIAHRLPEIQFDLYGKAPEEGSTTLPDLMRRAPANVHFRPPVFGRAKADVLKRASLYLQPSRFDGFSLSVADAMLHGVPCALSEEQAVADEVRANDIGMVLPIDPARAAAQLQQVLADRPRLQEWSVRGADFARKRFDAARAAAANLDFYREVLGRATA